MFCQNIFRIVASIETLMETIQQQIPGVTLFPKKRHEEVKRTVTLAATKWLFKMLLPILKGVKNALH